MADWILVPCLGALRAEFNRIAPGRDKASDGSVADAAHFAAGNSDHIPDEEAAALRDHDADSKNEVHALDVDDSGPWPDGFSMEKAVQHILARCRAGKERRLTYIIYERRIWSASRGWVQRAYTGANPHDKHAHFSASYSTGREADTSSWHLEDLVALTAADGKTVWSTDIIPNPKQRGDAAANPATTAFFALGDAWQQVYNLRDQLTALGKSLAAAIQAVAAKDAVDEAALAAALAPGLAAAVVAALPADRDDITPEELQEAITASLRDLVGAEPRA